MNKFTVNDHQMAYQDIGQGPVILFGHSFLWDSHMWAPQIEALSQQYRCIVPDFWGHGQSDSAPKITRTLKDYAQQLLALMDHLDIDQFSIVGLSVGGMWGAELTTLVPSRVNALVLMDTFVGLEPEVTHKKYFHMLDIITQHQAVPEPIIEAITPLFFANNANQDSPELVKAFKQHLSSLKGEQALEIARVGKIVFSRRDQIDELDKFTLPVLIAVGSEDKPRSMLESYLMQDCITGAQLIQIPNAGHISNLEQPQFVTEMLMTFLDKVYS
ncbi:alpha/beta fold hydrolase [Shewanella surugensis]|uniref:Alpha/beta fold hydrolase n=1 Tax=Shewanella surugensis TaxID=212020 RepID=A0ABT0LEN6_9GAMM|nr:alpha/beta fold hydrolase [Shewanella surugensis]MCL1125787.1 alpha/beta fold hydrolase [Shewanella surugensis]